MLPKKLLLLLFFIPSTISILKLFRITTDTKQSIQISISPLPLPPPLPCSSPSAKSPKKLSRINRLTPPRKPDNLTAKEKLLLSNLISLRSPCNLLFFGLNSQFLDLSTLNNGGKTAILEDNLEKLKMAINGSSDSEAIQIYPVKYHERASRAYEMLKKAREDPSCKPGAGALQDSNCALALKWLPKEVYRQRWHVVVVDGPSSEKPEAPGRMAAIYSAGMIARAGKKTTDVLVHDIDRTIERWYSWEFLCHENLVSSKGRFWHFRIHGNSSGSDFCPVAHDSGFLSQI